MKRQPLLLWLLTLAVLLSASTLRAQPIAYQIIVPATGSITYTNGSTKDFTAANTAITVFGDTANVGTLYIDGILEGYETNFLPASIVIQGLGSFSAGNFTVYEKQGGSMEFVQLSGTNVSQTISVQISHSYNLQTDITSSMSFDTNVFNGGYIQTDTGQISFINTSGTGLLAARLNK